MSVATKRGRSTSEISTPGTFTSSSTLISAAGGPESIRYVVILKGE